MSSMIFTNAQENAPLAALQLENTSRTASGMIKYCNITDVTQKAVYLPLYND